MSFEVTATKKRPRLFDQLAGQDFVVSTLKNSLRAGRIAHAYLFSGPRGIGKTSAARILAKALNCSSADGPTDTPCGVCANCLEITSGNALDVIEIDGASNTSVNDVRRIKDEVLFSPGSSRYKIYIIDEVHMLSNSAFNALLKTIEEPPSYIVFVFATTEVHKVPATIRSRCQQFHFQLLTIETISAMLAETASENRVEIEDDALFWIAKEAGGSMRDAYTLFDQVISFASPTAGAPPAAPGSGSEAQTIITMDMVRDKMGLVGVDTINTLVEALSRGNPGEALGLVHEMLRRGISVEQILTDTLEYFRALLLIRQGITAESLLGARAGSFSRAVVRAYAKEQLEAAVELILDTYRSIRYSLSQQFELELMISRLADLHLLVSQNTLIGKLAALKDQLLRGELTAASQSASSERSTQPEQTTAREQPGAAPVGTRPASPPSTAGLSAAPRESGTVAFPSPAREKIREGQLQQAPLSGQSPVSSRVSQASPGSQPSLLSSQPVRAAQPESISTRLGADSPSSAAAASSAADKTVAAVPVPEPAHHDRPGQPIAPRPPVPVELQKSTATASGRTEPDHDRTAAEASSQVNPDPEIRPFEVTRGHIEAVQAALKESSPSLSAALGKISDWHYHGNKLELIFPDAYTAGKIAGNIAQLQEVFFSLLRRRIGLKAVTLAEHERSRSPGSTENGDTGSPGSGSAAHEQKISLIAGIFRGTVVSGGADSGTSGGTR